MTVKQVDFEVPSAHSILENSHFIDLLAGEGRHRTANRRIVQTTFKGGTLSIWYSAKYIGGEPFPAKWKPRIEVRFETPNSIERFTDTLFLVTSFMSFNLGAYLRWQGANISHMDDDEINSAISTGTYGGRHRAIFPIGNDEPDIRGTGKFGSPCLCHNDEERAVFGDCLKKWLERAPEWKTAYGLMMSFLNQRRTIGADRLLAACKCLEQIPGTENQKVLDDDDIDEIISAAQTEADKLGHGKLNARIRMSLQRVGTEDHEARFSRLYQHALNGHASVRPFASVVTDLKNAMRLRGHAAHRALHTDTDVEFQTLVRAVSAVECLCFLLLARELPLSNQGKDRLFRNRLVADYANILDAVSA